MTPAIASLFLPLMRGLDPERAHDLALRLLRLGFAGRAWGRDDPSLAVTVLGKRFANPIGLAAGFDKGAVAARGLMRLGFGFVETGTVTPLPANAIGNSRIIAQLIGADLCDVVNLRTRDQKMMVVDDTGMLDGRPVNPIATTLYHAICIPGTVYAIHGDVAIVFDTDF